MIKIEKPYYRIYRPYKSLNYTPDVYDYILDVRNCKNRRELIKYFYILEKEVIDILEYIELSEKNMEVYSLKIYKAFLSICTEIENNFKGILYYNGYDIGKNLNMKNDYFKLDKVLKLSDYKVKILLNDYESVIQPFKEWKNQSDYKTIQWYKDYNDLKHNRSDNFEKAKLKNLIKSICALYIILYSQFYEYSKVINESTVIMTEDGQMLVQDLIDIIDIVEKPIWLEEEKYDFDWSKIKNSDKPYINTKLE